MMNVPSSVADILVVMADKVCPITASEENSELTISSAFEKWFSVLRASKDIVITLPHVADDNFEVACDKPHLYILVDIARVWLESTCIELKRATLEVYRYIIYLFFD